MRVCARARSPLSEELFVSDALVRCLVMSLANSPAQLSRSGFEIVGTHTRWAAGHSARFCSASRSRPQQPTNGRTGPWALVTSPHDALSWTAAPRAARAGRAGRDRRRRRGARDRRQRASPGRGNEHRAWRVPRRGRLLRARARAGACSCTTTWASPSTSPPTAARQCS